MNELLPAKSILLLCPAEVTGERAGLCRWLVQISLLKVNLPVGDSDLECGRKLCQVCHCHMLSAVTAVSDSTVLKLADRFAVLPVARLHAVVREGLVGFYPQKGFFSFPAARLLTGLCWKDGAR